MDTSTAPAGTAGHLIRAGHMVEEYSDGSERVFFTDAELDAMADDPLHYGLVACHRLHPLSALLSDGSCRLCEWENERHEEAAFAFGQVVERDRLAEPPDAETAEWPF